MKGTLALAAVLALLAGCTETELASAVPAAPGLHAQEFLVTDAALHPLAGIAVTIGNASAATDARGLAQAALMPGTHAVRVAGAGYLPVESLVAVPGPLLRVSLDALPPDVQMPVEQRFRTFVPCSLNLLLPFGHACALLNPGDAEGQWIFTLPGDIPQRSQWRVTYVAPETGHYEVRVVTPDSGAAGAGGNVIGVLRLNATERGELVLAHGVPGPQGAVSLDVTQGAKLVVFVHGSIASPAPLQGSPAGYGIGAELNHKGDLFVQQWDPRAGDLPAISG